jgi:hypothetical protein
MTPPDRSADALAGPLRWLGRAVVVVVGLWFIVNGLREQWSAAGTVATVLVVLGVVLGVVFAVVGLLYLARSGREG